MLTLPPKFENDIKQSSVTIYPLIQIGEEIFISQVKEMFDGQVYEDHNLKVSNIKESIDFESRNFKISNVSITLSNYADLSDKLSSIDLMNLPVYIYWKTQSCKSLTDCLKVYEANIRRFDHDEKTIKIKLEDSTQEKLKKDVPIANLGETKFIYSDKYINKYIPITYGSHDYAPAVLWKPDQESLNFYVICDDVFNIQGLNRDIDIKFQDSSRSLRAYKGTYVTIFDTVAYNDSFINPGQYEETLCYETNRDYIECIMTFDGGKPLNPFANDEFQGEFKRYPVGLELIDSDGISFDGTAANSWSWLDAGDDVTISNPQSFYDKFQSVFNDMDLSWDTYAGVPDIDPDGSVAESYDFEADYAEYETWKSNNLSEWYALTESSTQNLHSQKYSRDYFDYDSPTHFYSESEAESTDNYSIPSGQIDVGGDIFDFEPIKVHGVRFRGAEGTNKILYNYGWDKTNNTMHNDPTGIMINFNTQSDIVYYPERDGSIGAGFLTDWIGHRHTYNDRDLGYDHTDYGAVYGGSSGKGYMFPKNEVEGTREEFPYIGTVAISEGLHGSTGKTHGAQHNDSDYRVEIASSPSSFDTFNNYMIDGDGYDKATMSRLHRLKYMHAVSSYSGEETGLGYRQSNLAFMQLPNTHAIIKRLTMLRIIPNLNPLEHSSGFDFELTTDMYQQREIITHVNAQDDSKHNWGNTCIYSDPYMQRLIRSNTQGNIGIDTGGGWGFYEGDNDYSGYPGSYVSTPGHDYSHIWASEGYIVHCISNPSATYNWAGGAGSNGTQSIENYSGYNATHEYHPSESNLGQSWGSYRGYTPGLMSVKPYGNLIWIFGIKNNYGDSHTDGVDKFITVTLCPNSMNWDSANWMRGSFAADEWLADGLVSGTKSHYSLFELFDMTEFPLYIPYEMSEHGINMDVEGGDEGRYGWDGSRIVSPSYNCWWNGIGEDTVDLDLGSTATDSAMSGYQTSGQLYEGGYNRWFAISLRDMSAYTSAGFAQSLYGESVPMSTYFSYASDELAQENAMSELGHIRIGGGVAQGMQIDDHFTINADVGDESAHGHFLGLRLKLPEISLEDNIDMAHHAFWKRKIEFKRGEFEQDADDINYLYVFCTAIDLERDEESGEEDVLKTCTTGFRESLSTINSGAGSDGAEGTAPFTLNNIDAPHSLYIFNDSTTVGSLVSPNDVSLFGGSGGDIINTETIPYTGGGFGIENGYTPWGNPDDFSNFNIVVLADREADGNPTTSINLQLKLFETHIKHVCDFENLTDSDFYVKTKGRGYWSSYQINESGATITMYAHDSVDKPGEVIKHFLLHELELSQADIDSGTFTSVDSNHSDLKLAFSVKDKVDSKKLIEEICSNTMMFLTLSNQNKAKLISVESSYHSGRLIKNKSILNYKFTRTKLDDVKSKVMVKYDLDYATDEFRRNTGWFSAKDWLGDGDLGFIHSESNEIYSGQLGYRAGYFNLNENESDSELIFEAKYIRDRHTAYKLQEFLAMWYCNQHTIISIDLDIEYLYLEIGDIITFEKSMNNVKAYGEDYSDINGSFRNGQHILPYFMIQEISKKSNKVSIKCIQMHSLEKLATFPTFTDHPYGSGNITRRNTIPDMGDAYLIEDYISGENYFTREQIKSMDVNGTGNVSQADVSWMIQLMGEEE